MKKLTCILLVMIIAASCILLNVGCNKTSDWTKVEEQGFFTCGITLYEPMNYLDENDDLVGFDTEFAKAVAAKLGVEAKFSLISWGNKYMELESGAIDCIWNGFTSDCTEKDGTNRNDLVDFSYRYLNNSQCVVIKAANAATLTTASSLNGKKGVAEKSSAGESYAKEFAGEATYQSVTVQMNALMEVASGSADFAVVDVLLANSIVGSGDYASLQKVDAIEIEPEMYAIGFRKGSDMTDKVNAAIVELSEDGTLATIAEKYGVSNALVKSFA